MVRDVPNTLVEGACCLLSTAEFKGVGVPTIASGEERRSCWPLTAFSGEGGAAARCQRRQPPCQRRSECEQSRPKWSGAAAGRQARCWTRLEVAVCRQDRQPACRATSEVADCRKHIQPLYWRTCECHLCCLKRRKASLGGQMPR